MSRRIDASGKTTLSPEQRTAASGGKMLFTDFRGQRAALLISNDRLLAACFFPRAKSKIGAVYICKVKNAVKHLNAYFVEIGSEEREICFLPEREAEQALLLNRAADGRILEGDEFMVQVAKDAAKGKQASVTTNISLSNPYFALKTGNAGIGCSNKLTDEEKECWRERLEGWESMCTIPAGLVVRTRAAELLRRQSKVQETGNTGSGTTCAGLPPELASLVERWENLFHAAAHRICFSCLLDAPTPVEAALELAYPDEYEEIVTDDRALYEELSSMGFLPSDKKIRFYDGQQNGDFPLSKLYRVESRLQDALGRRVWLRSGGYLVIETTEAMTVIDVNSGKYGSGKNAEETYCRINREAADEIARQLRLRNLSGIIIVDFINMKSVEEQNALLGYLRALLKSDRQKTSVVDMTPLGLVEITRKKGSKPLAEQVELT